MTPPKKPERLTRPALEQWYEDKISKLEAEIETLKLDSGISQKELDNLRKLRSEETADKDHIREQLILAWLAVIDARFDAAVDQVVATHKLSHARRHIENALEKPLLRPQMPFWMNVSLMGGAMIAGYALLTGLWAKKPDAKTEKAP